MTKLGGLALVAAMLLCACPKSAMKDAGMGGGGGSLGGGVGGGGGGLVDAGGGGGDDDAGDDAGFDAGPPYTGPVQLKPSRSASIAITSGAVDAGTLADARVVAVNPDSDSLSVFDATAAAKVASVSFAHGARPVSVVLGPDNDTAYVVLRKAQQLAKVTGIGGTSPVVAATVAVGSEPTGVALS